MFFKLPLCVSVWVISLDPIPLGNFSVFRFTENFLSFVVALHIEDGLSLCYCIFLAFPFFFLVVPSLEVPYLLIHFVNLFHKALIYE